MKNKKAITPSPLILMKLIPFDWFIQFIKDNPKLFLDDYAQAVFWELAYEKLKTIDPVEIIEEMIGELRLQPRWSTEIDQEIILDNLLQKFNPQSHV